MKVTDASVLVIAVAGRGRRRARCADGHCATSALAAPHLVDLEVAGDACGVRYLRGHLSLTAPQRRSQRLAAHADRATRPRARCCARCWELRDNVTPYDAAYVALAEALGVPLLTADARLANAPGIRCEVELLT